MTSTKDGRADTDENVSHDDTGRESEAAIDRRTWLKLGGAAVAAAAGVSWKKKLTGQSPGTDSTLGYGGTLAITDLAAGTDPFGSVSESKFASDVTRLGTDGTLSNALSAGQSDLFGFKISEGTGYTVRFDREDAESVSAVGVHDPDGYLVDQVYASSNEPLYIPGTASKDGTHYLQVVDVDSSGEDYSLSLSTGGTIDSDQAPFEGTVTSLPGRVQAQDYDVGGEGVSYHDTTAGNEYDTSYRDGDVDIRETQDDSGAYNVGYFEDGEWLEYTVDPTPGTYDVRVRVASARSGRRIEVRLGDRTLGTVDVPNTGSWTTWETVTLENVQVEADQEQVLRLEADGSGIDFNWVEFATAPEDSEYGTQGYGEMGYGGTGD